MSEKPPAITTVGAVLQAIHEFESEFEQRITGRDDFQLKLFISGNGGRVTNVRLHKERNFQVDVSQ